MRSLLRKKAKISTMNLTFVPVLVSRLALLLPPVLLTLFLLACSIYTYGLSILLLYFVLPMFYAVDKRIRASVNGIASPRFSYADGYRAFFKENQGNFFGVVKILLAVLLALVLFALVFSSTLPSLMSFYPQALPSYENFMSLFSSGASNEELYTYLVKYGVDMVRPMTLYVGLVLFIPEVVFFFLLNENLSQHYLATILLPDIDSNVSPSHAKALARETASLEYTWYRYKKTWSRTWIYPLCFILLYVANVWSSSHIVVDNFYLMPLVFLLAPLTTLGIGLFFNESILKRHYQVIEQSQAKLVSSLSEKVKESLKQAYFAPSYRHGEESLVRGFFIKEETAEPKEAKPLTVVVDLSHK